MSAPLHHVLRWSPSAREPNTFFGGRRDKSPIVDIRMVVRHGEARVHCLNVTTIVYARDLPKDWRQVFAQPIGMSRVSEECFLLEAASLADGLPVASYLLSGIPARVADSWVVVK